MTKHNKLSDWLHTKSADESASLMSNARKSAKALRAKQREKEVTLAVRRKMLKNSAVQQELEMKRAASRKQLIEDVLKHGGPCRSPQGMKYLQTSFSGKELIAALKNEVCYQKNILGMPGVLKLSQTAKDLAKDLCDHLNQENQQGTSAKETESDASEDEDAMIDKGRPWQGHFEFSRAGSWVAVYYDNQLCVGEVIEVASATSAEVKFLEQTKANMDYFRWPRTDDIAVVDSKFVFAWDFDLSPVSSDCRIWKLECLPALKGSYSRIKNACLS